ncbi:hypothetical protein IGI37_002764 [Enterococcus sp. AZ194]|uniref:transposase n=1 Tax=Enterococcus sp. AZ194 TaxID=2774629 RepID=UPI003F240E30
MLKQLQTHLDYLSTQERLLPHVTPEAKGEYQETIELFRHLNFDAAHELLASLYSHTGRPALVQIEILRTMILCAYEKISWETALYRLNNRIVYRVIIGIDKESIPTLPSFYELSRRLMPTNEKSILRKKRAQKPTEKYKKNEKMPESKKTWTQRMADIARKGTFTLYRPDRFLQKLFKLVSIDTSVSYGLLDPELYVSGDGTCVYTGASAYGTVVCDCRKQGIFQCDCPKRYSDPNATWGWESSKERYFYGYNAYLLSTYNAERKLDLPLYLRMVSAKRHDSVSALIGLAEFRDLCPEFKMKGFLSDSASDNYETYHLLKEWKIPAFIALNNRKEGTFTYKQVEINSNGIPICEGGLEMTYDGRETKRSRAKFRCPAKMKKCIKCPLEKPCSSSPYGRTVYTKTDDNPRFFTEVPRDSKQWRTIMKQRTNIERINKQLLRDCGIEASGVRTRSRLTLWLTAAMMVIHLKAQYKYAG